MGSAAASVLVGRVRIIRCMVEIVLIVQTRVIKPDICRYHSVEIMRSDLLNEK